MNKAETELINIANEILAGTIGIVEGSRLILGFQSSITSDALDKDFCPFIGISSEADHIPFGDIRKKWLPSALKEADEELKAIEDRLRPFAHKSCEQLIRRLSKKKWPNHH